MTTIERLPWEWLVFVVVTGGPVELDFLRRRWSGDGALSSSSVANTFKRAEAKGFNPGLVVLLIIGGLLLFFLVGNYVLYTYAQKTLTPKRKKPVSKKKMKREKMKQGVSAPGE
ncbi:hypothetical protein Dimus_034612 [Dionaea muscipula]